MLEERTSGLVSGMAMDVGGGGGVEEEGVVGGGCRGFEALETLIDGFLSDGTGVDGD